MVNLNAILENSKLIHDLTGMNASEFFKQCKKWSKTHTQCKFKILDTPEKKFLFIKMFQHMKPTQSLMAILLGATNLLVHRWLKSLIPPDLTPRPKLKKLGALVVAFPSIREAMSTDEIHLPFQIATSSEESEHERLKRVVTTKDERVLTLMLFREEILKRDTSISIDTFIIDRYNNKYGVSLKALELKEMAYLWGVSIEYMTRVLNIALDKLQSDKKELWERLVVGYE